MGFTDEEAVNVFVGGPGSSGSSGSTATTASGQNRIGDRREHRVRRRDRRRFAADGARVVAAARRAARLAELAAEFGSSVLPVELDVTDRAAVDQAIATCPRSSGTSTFW